MSSPEQLLSASKASFDAAVEIGHKAYEGVEKLVELNLRTAREALGESSEAAKALLAAKDPQELLTLQQAYLQPAAEKASAYGREAYEIASTTQADLAKLMEAQLNAVQQAMTDMVDTMIKNAPAGTENLSAFMKSAMTATNTAVESVQKAAKQAVGVAEANFDAFSRTATQATKAAAPKAPRRAAPTTATATTA